MERKVIMTFKVFPTGVDVNLDSLLETIKRTFPSEEVVSRGREYIGYGIEALVVDLTVPERDGASQEYEEKMKSVVGVGEISVESVRRFVKLGKPS